MGKQGIRLDARRTVKEALDGIRKERLERDRRVSRLAVALVTAVARRDEVAAAAEQVAAETLRALLAEGLTLTDVGDLCGGSFTIKELTQLSRLRHDSRVAASKEA